MAQKDIPKQLFHYTTREVALEHILSTQRIRLALVSMTNDPREAKEWGHPIQNMSNWDEDGVPVGESHFIRKAQAIQDEANRIRREEWKMLCLYKHRPELKPASINRPDGNPFHNGYCRSRMWAQYANNHTGVCLIFDGPALDRAIREELELGCTIQCGAVEYRDEWYYDHDNVISYSEFTHPALTSGLRRLFFERWEAYFLRKAQDWQSEWEYRWLVHSEDSESKYVPIEDALLGVLVGEDFREDYEPSLVALCEKLSAHAGRITWMNGYPNANFGSIFRPEPVPTFEIKHAYTYEETANIWSYKVETVEQFVGCGKVSAVDSGSLCIPYEEVLRVWRKQQPVFVPEPG